MLAVAAAHEHRVLVLGAWGCGVFRNDPALVADPALLPINQKRLRFYEQYGAFPIEGTRYETLPPDVKPYDPPYLVYDPLGRRAKLSRADARRVVRDIFVLKYGWDEKHPYVVGVLESFHDDPVRLRPARYVQPEPSPRSPVLTSPPTEERSPNRYWPPTATALLSS